jgi:MFS family permease
MTDKPLNSPRQVLFASLIGTTIEFFDFYIYGMAAVLVFPALFFPASDPASARLASLATFGIAFLARPIGSALFGHFGDRIGRKTTLVIALSTMGLSTVAIGALPTYRSIGIAAPLLLALCRFGQGIGLGGEWGGAVLLAIENAPPNKRAWYGMFPQLGAPIGFFLSGCIFLLLSRSLPAQCSSSSDFTSASPSPRRRSFRRRSTVANRSKCPSSPSCAAIPARLSPAFFRASRLSSSSTL